MGCGICSLPACGSAPDPRDFLGIGSVVRAEQGGGTSDAYIYREREKETERERERDREGERQRPEKQLKYILYGNIENLGPQY